MIKKPLVNDKFLIEKRIAESGFKFSDLTYVVIPGIPPALKALGGTVRVSGLIDNYELKQYNLLPMKDGCMLLPLKAAVRKKIGKKEGDFVQVILYADDSPVIIPDDLALCLMDSPGAYSFFLSFSESNQKYYIDWIEEAKKMETKIERMAGAVERLEKGLRFYDWIKQP